MLDAIAYEQPFSPALARLDNFLGKVCKKSGKRERAAADEGVDVVSKAPSGACSVL